MKKIKRLLLKYKEVIMYLIFGVATDVYKRQQKYWKKLRQSVKREG